MKVFEALAGAFRAEGTEVVFGLMGDGNMYWMAAAGRLDVRLVHARHENAAVAMADGYARATGRVGVASVTAGPGLTQIATSLTASVRHRTPLVVFAGDTPAAAAFNLQELDQAPFVAACGAGFVQAGRVERASEDVAFAFYRAQHERRPIVLSAPWDVQDATYPWDLGHTGSADLLPPRQRLGPDPAAVGAAAEALVRAARPVVLAGDGAVRSGARSVLEQLAERVGGLLATSLRAKGLFAGTAWDIGVCGAFATDAAREVLADADLVLGVGASLGYFTTEAGYLFPDATVIQVDEAPVGYVDGQRVADLFVHGDAAVSVAAIDAALAARGHRSSGFRDDATAARLRQPPPPEHPFPIPAGTVDPRVVMRELQSTLPPDLRIIIGAGHFWNFAVGALGGRAPDRYVYTYDFGVIGQGLPTAMGVSVGDDRPVALIEGDGSLLMNVQELEALSRHRLPVLVLVIDDGAYGAEVHKMRAKGFVDDEASFGFVALDEVAAAFEVRAHRVAGPGQLAPIVAAFLAEPKPTVVDVRVSPEVVAPTYRRLYYGDT